MAEPNISVINTGTGLSAIAMVVLGPILGEYAIIGGLGLLGTLMALSETVQPNAWRSILFVIKGLIFSFVFTGIVTAGLVTYVLPLNLGAAPYVVMGVVSFVIGWLSDRFSLIKEKLFQRFMSLIDKPSK